MKFVGRLGNYPFPPEVSCEEVSYHDTLPHWSSIIINCVMWCSGQEDGGLQAAAGAGAPQETGGRGQEEEAAAGRVSIFIPLLRPHQPG